MAERIAIFWSHGLAFCPACQSQLAGEEIDFECCDACGGDGIGDDENDIPDDEMFGPDFEETPHDDA